MNFSHILGRMNQNQEVSAETFDDDGNMYHIYRTKGSKRFVAYNVEHLLGKGSFANVYRAYYIQEDGMLDLERPLAAKSFYVNNQTKESIKKEFILFKKYYPHTTELIETDTDMIMLMPLMPGDDLSDIIANEESAKVKLRDLSFSERIHLIAEIANAYNLMHHHTPRTGSALFMKDIKAQNIRVNISDDKKKIDVYPVDFGLAQEVEDFSSLPIDVIAFTEKYASPEIVLRGQGGVKSDIWTLVPDFAAILGAKNPFENREKFNGNINGKEYFDTQFNFSGIFLGVDIPNYPHPIVAYIIMFLNRMQGLDYDDRPDSDEVLKFFTTLSNYCKTFEVLIKKGDGSNLGKDEIKPEVVLNNDEILSMHEHALKLHTLANALSRNQVRQGSHVFNRPAHKKLIAQSPFDDETKKKLFVSTAIYQLSSYLPEPKQRSELGKLLADIVGESNQALRIGSDKVIEGLFKHYQNRMKSSPNDSLALLLGKALAISLNSPLPKNGGIYTIHTQIIRKLGLPTDSHLVTELKVFQNVRKQADTNVGEAISKLESNSSINNFNFPSQLWRYLDNKRTAKAEMRGLLLRGMDAALQALNQAGGGEPSNMKTASQSLMVQLKHTLNGSNNLIKNPELSLLTQALQLASQITVTDEPQTRTKLQSQLANFLPALKRHKCLQPYIKHFKIYANEQYQKEKLIAALDKKIAEWDLNPFMRSKQAQRELLNNLKQEIKDADGKNFAEILATWGTKDSSLPDKSNAAAMHTHRLRFFADKNKKTAGELFLDSLEKKFKSVHLKKK